MKIRTQVPASSANLGSGFDCLGLGLNWYDYVDLDTDFVGREILVFGEGENNLAKDESNLVFQSLLKGIKVFGGKLNNYKLTCHNSIPHSRGLGSSAAAIVSGLSLAWGLSYPGEELDRKTLLKLATEIEGHPDNVAAAIYGGVVLSFQAAAKIEAVQLKLHSNIECVALVPAFKAETRAARAILPDKVSHQEAVQQATHSAMLVAALTEYPEMLYFATEDVLHQKYRSVIMQSSYELLLELRKSKIPAVISGAGPTVLVLGFSTDINDVAKMIPKEFKIHPLFQGKGASLVRPC